MTLTIDEPAPEPSAQAADARDIVLAGADADAYVDRLIRAINAARLNAMFPPVRQLVTHLSFLGPHGSHGVHPQRRVS